MQDMPHHYSVNATAATDGNVELTVDALPAITSAPPREFDGPGDQWSPEHLLTASVADCFILTFRAVAQASRLEWSSLQVSAEGTLDRVERVTQFTHFTVNATLTVPEGTDAAKATRVMEKAEAACMITNSLSADTHLQASVVTGG